MLALQEWPGPLTNESLGMMEVRALGCKNCLPANDSRHTKHSPIAQCSYFSKLRCVDASCVELFQIGLKIQLFVNEMKLYLIKHAKCRCKPAVAAMDLWASWLRRLWKARGSDGEEEGGGGETAQEEGGIRCTNHCNGWEQKTKRPKQN